MKYRLATTFVIIGGLLGFISHVLWHYRTGVELFNIAPHNLFGFINTGVGMIIGFIVWYVARKK